MICIVYCDDNELLHVEATVPVYTHRGKNGISLYRIGTGRLYEIPYARYINIIIMMYVIIITVTCRSNSSIYSNYLQKHKAMK